MTITLHPDVQRFIDEKVHSGQFASVEEAVNSLLGRVREQEALTPEDIDDLRAEIDIGIAEADRGQFVEFSAQDVIAEQRKSFKKQARGQ